MERPPPGSPVRTSSADLPQLDGIQAQAFVMNPERTSRNATFATLLSRARAKSSTVMSSALTSYPKTQPLENPAAGVSASNREGTAEEPPTPCRPQHERKAVSSP